ncbi:hypothetical protein GGR55DRAFT_632644 [Xylaria sp. FL0064]|nr:hypothetical protein GGR55DRAFT_632644 [Xylaria sp. FL0064]
MIQMMMYDVRCAQIMSQSDSNIVLALTGLGLETLCLVMSEPSQASCSVLFAFYSTHYPIAMQTASTTLSIVTWTVVVVHICFTAWPCGF